MTGRYSAPVHPMVRNLRRLTLNARHVSHRAPKSRHFVGGMELSRAEAMVGEVGLQHPT